MLNVIKLSVGMLKISMEQHTLKKCIELLEYQNLHLLSDIWC